MFFKSEIHFYNLATNSYSRHSILTVKTYFIYCSCIFPLINVTIVGKQDEGCVSAGGGVVHTMAGMKRASSVDSCQSLPPLTLPFDPLTSECDLVKPSFDNSSSFSPAGGNNKPHKHPGGTNSMGSTGVNGSNSGGGGNSRKLGRNPRVPFTSGQVAVLEQKYQLKQYLSSIDVAELSTLLNLNDSRVSSQQASFTSREILKNPTVPKIYKRQARLKILVLAEIIFKEAKRTHRFFSCRFVI